MGELRDRRHVFLIDWVNSLDVPSCALVDGFECLQSGKIVADIIAFLLDRKEIRGIEHQLVSKLEAIQNWNIILNELYEILPDHLKELQAEDFYEEEENIIQLLEFLSSNEEIFSAIQETNNSPPKVFTFKKEPMPAQLEKRKAPIPMSPQPKHPIIMSPQHSKKAKISPIPQNVMTPKVPRVLMKQKSPSQPNISRKPLVPPVPTPLEPQPALDGDLQEEAERDPIKEEVVQWLEFIQIIKKDTVEQSLLPELCRTGVLLSDIYNRFAGREGELVGIQRAPKNRTAALTNISKVLGALREQKNFQSNFMWARDEILEGDSEVI